MPVCMCRRIFHACTACCCPQCCCGTCTSAAEKDPVRHVYGRWFAALKACGIIFAIGLIASCIYGMVKAGPMVVQDAYSTMDGVEVMIPSDIHTCMQAMMSHW